MKKLMLLIDVVCHDGMSVKGQETEVGVLVRIYSRED